MADLRALKVAALGRGKVSYRIARVESSNPKNRSIRQLPSACRSRKATYLPNSLLRRPRESRQDCSKAPNSIAGSGATRRAETVRRRSMFLSDAQLLRAIAASWAGPRNVLKAGHSNTAVSVYSAAYAWGSWLRYA